MEEIWWSFPKFDNNPKNLSDITDNELWTERKF
jgi:hypothetical protein